MNPSRYLHDGWSPWFIALFALAATLFAIVAWLRYRERRGDWGPGLVGVREQAGYSPADLRGSAANVSGSAQAIRDPHEWWLLGLAAPWVEQERLLHDRWSLVPAACDDAWRRHLLAVASRWGVVRAHDWKSIVADLEEQLAASPTPGPGWVDIRPWLAARLAMNLRLGVAARHTSGRRARERLAAAAAPLRSDYADWLGYGDAFIEATRVLEPESAPRRRADLRILYAPGGPWHAPSSGV